MVLPISCIKVGIFTGCFVTTSYFLKRCNFFCTFCINRTCSFAFQAIYSREYIKAQWTHPPDLSLLWENEVSISECKWVLHVWMENSLNIKQTCMHICAEPSQYATETDLPTPQNVIHLHQGMFLGPYLAWLENLNVKSPPNFSQREITITWTSLQSNNLFLCILCRMAGEWKSEMLLWLCCMFSKKCYGNEVEMVTLE